MTRDLATQPAWQEQDLGMPLPDSLHACSVCLPTWDSIVDYEEGDPKVVQRLRAGYPRFFKHPLVSQLIENAKGEVADENENLILLPTKLSVQRAHRWVEQLAESAVRITSYHGLQALIVPNKAIKHANAYWRFSGEVVSSRQAQDILDGTPREGSKSHLIARAMTKFTGASVKNTFIFSSGMSAVTSVLRALPEVLNSKKTLQIQFPYVDCLKVQEHFGYGVVYLNDATGDAFEEALHRIRKGEFAGVFTEIPSNPLLKTADLAQISAACSAGRTPLIVDDSASGPFNVDSLRYADVVTSSLTKWVSGTGDVMAGMVTIREDSRFANSLRPAISQDSTECAPLYIGDAEVLLSNLNGYAKRMKTINENGYELAAWLANHPAVSDVWHPSLTTREHYDAILKPEGGYGGLLSFALKSPKKTPKFYDELRLSKGPSFGTPFTIVCPYTMLAHYPELEWAEACGVPSRLIRVSCGLEPISQLIETFDHALKFA